MCSFDLINHEQVSKYVEVTIVCSTYNHCKYIRDCLDSLINQDTTFKYKVLIHDDASTDGTAEIVREYCRTYPSLLEAIIEKENLFSKGITLRNIIAPYISGRYVALCEGDDFWTSSTKLQIQFDFMNVHPDYSMCLHEAVEFDDREKRFTGMRCMAQEDCDVSLGDILLKWPTSCATNSMMRRKELYVLPDVFSNWGVGDYPSAIYAALCGKVRYISKNLSAYRINTVGSWTSRHKSREKQVLHTQRVAAGLAQADEYSGLQYHDDFVYTINMLTCEINALKRNPVELIKNERAVWSDSRTSLLKLGALWGKCMFPSQLVNLLGDLKRHISSGVHKHMSNHIKH